MNVDCKNLFGWLNKLSIRRLKIERKAHIILSRGFEKAFDKIQHSSMI
jgi:hypothetical protein